LVLIVGVVFALAGCHKNDYLRPPMPPEEFAQPPADDARFSGPPVYPAKLLNQDTIGKDREDDPAQGHGPGHVGGVHGP
jgi:hypothetical protein